MKNTSQGYNSWYYLSNESNDEKQMIFDSSKESFVYGEVFIKNEFCYSKNNINVIRRFISNIEGLATIYGNPKLANLNDKKAEIKIIINGEEVFKTAIDEGDLIGKYIETNYQLKVGDIVDFVVKSEDSTVNFSPVITLDNSQKSSLYHKNDFGKFYGDVFPWYNEEEHRLYMWYLWSDNCNFTYNHCIDLSDNLIKMAAYPEENNFNLYDKYRHNYRYNEVFDVSRFIDSENYPVGVRDNMLYKDEENKRYLLIAGCYRSFDVNWDSDLNIYASKDPFALEWNTKPNKVHAGYVSHLPECPSLLKIKNRWYPFVSVSHVTAHQIGGLQYWLGDENVDCMDIDWSKKKIYWLDGEDLCAARPTQIGDKTYMMNLDSNGSLLVLL